MTRDEALAALLAVTSEVAPEIDTATITDQTTLRDDLDLDSVDFLNVVIGIHEQYGIDIPEREYDNMERVGDIVGYLSTPA
jgi:acyl carrier protein